jgi:hypothetical protein
VSRPTVGRWRQRFVESRCDGLLDEPKPGAPRRITDADVERVLTTTLESTPRDATHWSTRSLSKLQPALLEVDVTDLGIEQVAQTRGRVLQFAGRAFDVRVVLDERTYQPLAVVRTSALQLQQGTRETLNVGVLSDCRLVGDIKFPSGSMR